VIYVEVDKEWRKSEKLLLNILPRKVIMELKEKGNASPEIFKDVTVLFSDIVGFTDISTKLPVDTLITGSR
jgi:adenylate cyclase